MRLLQRVQDDVAETAKVEQHPRMEGRQMLMVLAPEIERRRAGAPANAAYSGPSGPRAGRPRTACAATIASRNSAFRSGSRAPPEHCSFILKPDCCAIAIRAGNPQKSADFRLAGEASFSVALAPNPE